MSLSPPKRVERTYSAEVRTHYVNLMTSTDGAASSAPLSPRALSHLDGAPPYETLKRWRREFSHPRAPHKRKGRPQKVTLDEQEIMAGYTLFLLKRQHIVDAEVLIDFLSVAFNKAVDKSWVSRHMPKLGFSLHRPAGQPLKFFNKNALPTAIKFVDATRPVLNAFGDNSRIVAMDQISFWDNGLVTSSYSPIGG